MEWKRILNLVMGLAIMLSLLPVLAVAAPPAEVPVPSKIEGALLDTLSTEGTSDFIARFVDQANLDPAFGMGWDARGEFVYNTLQETAAQSQVNAKAYLDDLGLEYHTFIAGNELYVWAGNLDAANALAALPEVDSIRATRTMYIDPIVENTSSTPDSPDALAWGILDVKADQFWAAFTFQGDGIVVANIDTGVEYNHSALDQSYKCWPDPSDPACWEDPSNICPGGNMCDNNGHGTHTMGTMVADDDPSLTWQAGMAPNAQWIACKGCESSSCSDLALNACADWILAPDGDPANRPHVVNNSWGGGGCDSWYQAKVQAWRAAGTFPAFSAGNDSGCSSMGSPGDYQESFASTGHNSSRVHFYAQGPSCYGHDPYTKPNITAPAISVCSSVPGNSWSCGYSGTSMASPHSAGAVALLWSCNPSLIGQIDTTFQALQDNTDPPDPTNPPCGVPPDNEGTYEDGYGYLNVLAAGTAWCGAADTGWLDGYVTETGTGDPIEGASVIASPAVEGVDHIEAVTDPTGYYTMTLLVGTYDVTASKNGYQPQTVTGVEILDGQVTSQDFQLTFLGGWTEMPYPVGPHIEYNRFDGVFNPHDGLVYFLSGRTGGASHDNDIWTFDPATNTYTDTGDDMLYNIANFTIHLIEDDGTGRGEAMYIIGGYDAVLAVNHDHVQRYYPQSGTVEEVVTDPYPDLAPNNLPVGAGGSATLNDKIYVFGGWDSALPYFSDKTWEFDPQAAAGSKWTEITTATLNPARSYINVAAQDDLIYAMGGHMSYTGADLVPTDVVEVFDPANPGAGWVALTSMPVATAEGRGFGFQVDTLGLDQFPGKIYVAGGGDWPDLSAEAMEYDIATDTWDPAFPDLITARRDHAGVYVETCTPDPTDGLPGMWVFGGHIGSDEPPFGLPEFFPLPCPEQHASFDADPVEGCAPLQVQFQDTSTPIPDQWLWDFGDGSTSTEQHPTYTYLDAGTFTVTLTVTGTGGTDWTTGTIDVYATPDAAFTWSPSTIYTDTVVQFTDGSTGPVAEWLWETSDGYTYNIQNPTHTFENTGTFTVTLTVTSAMGCSDELAQELVVLEPEEPPPMLFLYLPIVVRD